MPKVLVPKAVHTIPRSAASEASSLSSSGVLSSAETVARTLMMDQPARMVGVGIIFNTDEMGALRVKGLAPGGPAASTGRIKPGDILVEIDGRDVYRHSVSKVQVRPASLLRSAFVRPASLLRSAFVRPASLLRSAVAFYSSHGYGMRYVPACTSMRIHASTCSCVRLDHVGHFRRRASALCSFVNSNISV
jgi:hypothetical protein